MEVLKHVKRDLVEADVNEDGRIDYEELKAMLEKYPSAFSQDDIERIGELFYVGRSGSSVPHFIFLRAIQHVMRNHDKASVNSSDSVHPIKMESLDDDRCWVSPEEAAADAEQYYNIQAQFEKCLLDYAKEIDSAERKKTE